MSSENKMFSPEDLKQLLNQLGKGFCLLLDFLPSKELSFPIEVEGGCTLLLTINKK